MIQASSSLSFVSATSAFFLLFSHLLSFALSALSETLSSDTHRILTVQPQKKHFQPNFTTKLTSPQTAQNLQDTTTQPQNFITSKAISSRPCIRLLVQWTAYPAGEPLFLLCHTPCTTLSLSFEPRADFSLSSPSLRLRPSSR